MPTGFGPRRTDQATDQRVRRTRWNTVMPGDDVPADRPDERPENHILVDDFGIDRAFAYGCGHLQMENEIRDDIERGGESDCLLRLEDAGGNHRCDGIG